MLKPSIPDPNEPLASGERTAAASALEFRDRQAEAVFDATIVAMAALAEPGEAGNHIRRVQHYARAMAHKLRQHATFAAVLSDDFVGAMVRAVPMHDIGNSGVPDRVLLKPGPLTDEEIAVVRTHPVLGRDVIDQIQHMAGVSSQFLDLARQIAYGHHEHWDGQGYPQGITGEHIPVVARIMAIVDAYDALTSHRVYRDGVAHDKALQQIFQARGTQFDPDMVDALIEIQDECRLVAQRFEDTQRDLQRQIDYMAKAIAENP